MADLMPALPATPDAPAWFAAVDGGAIADRLNAALKHKSHKERWKYTRVQPVLALLNEPANAVTWRKLPDGITLSTLSRQAAELPAQAFFSAAQMEDTLLAAPEAIAALCYQDTLQVLDVTGEITSPLEIRNTGLQQPLLIRLAANASLDLREVSDGEAVTQLQSLWIDMQPGSRLLHSRNNFAPGTHWQFLRVHLGADATYRLHNHSSGSQLRRQDMQVICAAPGAHAEITSAALAGEATHLDQQVTIEHRAPHTTSRQTFHNIAAARAKITFNGRIHIHRDCGGVDAHLSNKNLSLADGAVVNTKPELEIYTDDVKCSHGATVGSLDPNHLFYFASRGIAPQQARTLLSQAFLRVCTEGPLAETAQQTLQRALLQGPADG